MFFTTWRVVFNVEQRTGRIRVQLYIRESASDDDLCLNNIMLTPSEALTAAAGGEQCSIVQYVGEISVTLDLKDSKAF